MHLNLKQLGELTTTDLEAIMMPRAAARIIRRQSGGFQRDSIAKLKQHSKAVGHSRPNLDPLELIAKRIETGKLVLIRIPAPLVSSVVSPSGNVNHLLPNVLGNKIHELAELTLIEDIESHILNENSMKESGGHSSTPAVIAAASNGSTAPVITRTIADAAAVPLEDINIELVYEDIEKTPATKVPYRIVFSDGEERTGVLDDKGLAVETGVPAGGGTIEFCYADDESALESKLNGLYGELGDAVQQSAVDMRDFYRGLLASIPPPDETDKKTKALRENLKRAAEAEIAEIKARADEFDALPSYQAAWENAKAAANGVGKGITEYIPDLGEFGALMDVIDIDITVMIEAIYTGDITDLQKQFQAWENRGTAGYESATESMEVLILLLSDQKTREILLSLPQRFFEVMPENELIEIGIAQGTQAGMDAGAVVVTTIAVGAVTGPGGAVAGAAVAGATTARKGAKALEGMTDVLTKLIDVLKKVRNKNTHTKIEKNKTPLDKDKKDDKPRACPICNKASCDNKAKPKLGKGENTRQDSTLYAGIAKTIPGFPEAHPWFTGSKSLEVHHVIPCKSVSDKLWKKLFNKFSYDINEAHNSVVLPGDIELACELGVQRHKGSHTQGIALKENDVVFSRLKEHEEAKNNSKIKTFQDTLFKTKKGSDLRYTKATSDLIEEVQHSVEKGKLCQFADNPKKLNAKFEFEMKERSKKILNYINDFSWTIAWDGRDYRPDSSLGCCNTDGITTKRIGNNRAQDCNVKRNHNLGKGRFTGTLRLGK